VAVSPAFASFQGVQILKSSIGRAFHRVSRWRAGTEQTVLIAAAAVCASTFLRALWPRNLQPRVHQADVASNQTRRCSRGHQGAQTHDKNKPAERRTLGRFVGSFVVPGSFGNAFSPQQSGLEPFVSAPPVRSYRRPPGSATFRIHSRSKNTKNDSAHLFHGNSSPFQSKKKHRNLGGGAREQGRNARGQEPDAEGDVRPRETVLSNTSERSCPVSKFIDAAADCL